MATEDNTTDKLTLLPLDLTKQTEREKKLGKTYRDLYSALAEAQANENWGRVSAINQAIKAEDQGLGGSEAWNLAAADQKLPAGIVPEQSDLIKGAAPGLVSGLTVDNLGMMNRLIDIDYLAGEGDDPDRGFIDYFANTYKGAISGEDEQGEMFISFEELDNNPNLQEWLNNAGKGMEENTVRLMNEFMEDKKFKTEADYILWLHDLKDKESKEGLSDEELEDLKYIQKLEFQRKNPKPYIDSPDDKGIIISSYTLPDIAQEPDPKFVDGRLQLPYFGTLERDKEGNLNMPAASIFRFTDNPLYGLENIAETHAPEMKKSAEDFFYPKLSPWWDYGENTRQQQGYQLGQIASGAGILKTVGKPLLKHGYKGGKGLYNLARRKLFGYEPVDTSSWKLTP